MHIKINYEKASHTAGYTCFTRACATRENNGQNYGPDYLAEIFLPAFAKLILNTALFRKVFIRKIAPSGAYEYIIARTQLFDEIFLDALENDVRQIVIFGAGMDTRALRFKDKNQGIKVIELDIEKTQRTKLQILKRKKVALPEELIFAPIDFNNQSLREVLQNIGYKNNLKTLFLLEGVTMYLRADAVDKILAFIRKNSQKGSKIAFDYIYASVLNRENKFYGEREIFDTISKTRERWAFGVEEGDIEKFLLNRGFKLISHYSPPEIEEKYLKADNQGSIGRINGTHCIVQAAVN